MTKSISLLAAALISTPLIGHSGELENLFKQAHSGVVMPSEASRSFAEVDAVQSDITEVGVEHVPWYALDAPVFSVIIRADGSFTYNGERNVKRLGEHTGHISTMDVKPLFQYIRGINFQSLSDFYSSRASDQPLVYIMVSQNGQRKIVKNHGTGGPLSLWALENTINALLSRAAWDK